MVSPRRTDPEAHAVMIGLAGINTCRECGHELPAPASLCFTCAIDHYGSLAGAMAQYFDNRAFDLYREAIAFRTGADKAAGTEPHHT